MYVSACWLLCWWNRRLIAMELVWVAMKPPGRLHKEWKEQWSPNEWVEYRKQRWAADAEEPVEVKLARFLLGNAIRDTNDVKRRRTE